MKPTEPEAIVASQTQVGDVLINATRTVQVLVARVFPGLGAVKLICQEAGAPSGQRPCVMWIRDNTPLNRFASNAEITARQAASLHT
jgi:hypothetical protein